MMCKMKEFQMNTKGSFLYENVIHLLENSDRSWKVSSFLLMEKGRKVEA